MKPKIAHLPLYLLCILPQLTYAETSWSDSLSAALKQSTIAADFRYRFEAVDQGGFDKDAKASLLRSRVSLQTGEIERFSVYFEVDNVTSIFASDYNSTENQKTRYPVVADPEGTDINQVFLSYNQGKNQLRAGRQRILHGNQRFVGGVAWRQNEQTYDGIRGQLALGGKVQVDLAYVYNVNRIFGPNDGTNPADWEGDNVLARFDYSLNTTQKLSAFVYLLDIDGQGGYTSSQTVNNSTDTVGVEYQGKFEGLSLHAAYARQSEGGDSQQNFDTDYYTLDAEFDLERFTLKAGYEVLAANNGVGFKTPLATLHKFQGWADKFLATPADGIEDAYVAMSAVIDELELKAVYHDFSAESSSASFGNEFDLSATWKVNAQLSVQIAFADFDSDDSQRFSDTQKLWMTAQLRL